LAIVVTDDAEQERDGNEPFGFQRLTIAFDQFDSVLALVLREAQVFDDGSHLVLSCSIVAAARRSPPAPR
jgi:hypothetical protein